MKKIVLVVFLLVFLLILQISGEAFSPPESVIRLKIGSKELWVNGEIQEPMDVAPFIKDNRTWVPVRFVSEALGAQVDWKGDQKQVIINLEGDTLILTIGSTSLLVNGNSKLMDVAPFISESRTWVPLRFVAENLGSAVSWVGGSKEVLIRKGVFSEPTVAYVQDGNLVVAEVKDNKINGRKTLVEGGVSGPIAWSANGLKIAYYLVEKLSQWEFNLTLEYCVEPSGERIPFLYQDNLSGSLKPLSWEPGDQFLLYDEPSVEFSGTLFEIAPETGEKLQLGAAGAVVYGLFSPDRIHMAWMVNDEEGFQVMVWDQDGLILKIQEETSDFAFSSDGSRLAISTPKGIKIYDLFSPSTPPLIFPFERPVYHLLWSPNDTLIAGSDSEGGVFGLELTTGNILSLDMNPGSRPAGFLPSGDLIIEHPLEFYLGGSTYYLHEMETDTVKLFLEGAEFLTVRPN